MSTSRICHDSMILYVYTFYRYFLTGFLDVLLTLGGCQVVIVRSEKDCHFKEAFPMSLQPVCMEYDNGKKSIFEVSKLGPPQKESRFKLNSHIQHSGSHLQF